MNPTIRMAVVGLIPDSLIRWGIRRICGQRKRELPTRSYECERLDEDFVKMSKDQPIAPVAEVANEQHYEVPTDFFKYSLGSNMKYSSCYWPEGVTTLDQAEEASLRQTVEHADLRQNQNILELGCGWGSLSLWIAKHFPESKITGVSNSSTQREYILGQAEQRGLKNIKIITADMNTFDLEEKFDRVVSVEMFEHMRNLEKLLSKISKWLKDDGKLMVHIFCHKNSSYEYVVNDNNDWMSKYFFTGGMMPSQELLTHFQKDLVLKRRWFWEGQHYEKTSNAWLENLDNNRDAALKVLEKTYGSKESKVWFQRWRMFFMACAEMFGHDGGQEWKVAHYLFNKK